MICMLSVDHFACKLHLKTQHNSLALLFLPLSKVAVHAVHSANRATLAPWLTELLANVSQSLPRKLADSS